jgi:hypothetical protein
LASVAQLRFFRRNREKAFRDFFNSIGQFLPPSLATAMEEIASTPDAKARNRYTPSD